MPAGEPAARRCCKCVEAQTDNCAGLGEARVIGDERRSPRVTLENCVVVQRGTSTSETSNRVRESYRPEIACVGAMFATGERLAFDEVFVAFTSLHAWTALSGFEPMWGIIAPDEDGTYTQRFREPPPRISHLSDGSVLTLAFPLRETHDGLATFRKTFTQATRFQFSFAEPTEFRHVRRKVGVLRDLLTLGVGDPVNVTEIHGYAATPHPESRFPGGREARVYGHWIDNSRAQDAMHHHGMMFLLQDLDENFDGRVRAWFDAVEELGRVIDH